MRLLLAAAIIFVLARPGMAQEKIRLRIAIPDFTSSSVPVELARQKGYFSQEGLEVEMIRMSCAISIRALVAKSIDFDSCASMKALLSAASQGVRMKVILSRFNRPLMDIIGVKDIEQVADLRGKTIASGSRGSSAELFLEEFLARNGMDPTDVQLFSVGTTTDRVAALFAGRVTATLLSPPWNFRAIDQGYRRIANLGDSIVSFQGALVAMQSTLDERKPAVLHVLRALLRGLNFFRSHKDESIAIMVKFTKVHDRDFSERVYDYLLPSLTADGSLSEAVVQAEMARASRSVRLVKPVDAADIFDFSYVREASRSLPPIAR